MGSSVQIIDILSSSDDEEETAYNDGDNKPTITALTNSHSNGIKLGEKEQGEEVDLIDSQPQPSRLKESHALSQQQQQASSNQCSVNNSPNKELTPEACAESRRRKIDILLDNYERGQHRLRTVESMMDAAQKLRWYRLQSNNSQPASVPIDVQIGHNQASSSSGPNPRPNCAAPPHQPFQRPPWFIDPHPGEVVRTVRVTTTTRTTRPLKKKTYKRKKARSSTTKRAPRASAARASSARASTSYSSTTRSPRKSTASSSSTPLRSPKKEYTRSAPLKSPKKEFKPSLTVKRES